MHCNVGVFWRNDWMDQDATWYGGRSRPHGKGHSSPPPFSVHLYCGEMVAHLSNCWALVALNRQFHVMTWQYCIWPRLEKLSHGLHTYFLCSTVPSQNVVQCLWPVSTLIRAYHDCRCPWPSDRLQRESRLYGRAPSRAEMIAVTPRGACRQFACRSRDHVTLERASVGRCVGGGGGRDRPSRRQVQNVVQIRSRRQMRRRRAPPVNGRRRRNALNHTLDGYCYSPIDQSRAVAQQLLSTAPSICWRATPSLGFW